MIDVGHFEKPRVPDTVSVERLYYAWRLGQQIYGPRCHCSACVSDAGELQQMFLDNVTCPNRWVYHERGREAAAKLAERFPEPEAEERVSTEEIRKAKIRSDFPKWEGDTE